MFEVKKELDRRTPGKYVSVFEKSGVVRRTATEPPFEPSEEDLIRIADQWLRAEAGSWTSARRRVFFRSARRYAMDGLIALLVVAGVIGLLAKSGYLESSGIGARSTPLGAAIWYLPDKVSGYTGNASAGVDQAGRSSSHENQADTSPLYAATGGSGRQSDPLSGKKGVIPSTVTVSFSFQGALPLEVGDRIEVDQWETYSGADHGQFKAQRIAWRGQIVEAEASQQVAPTSRSQNGRVSGIVRSYRQEGNVARLTVTVDRKVYEQYVVPSMKQSQ